MEGAHCFADAACSSDGLVTPLAEYGHDQGCSVTGGYVYRGGSIDGLRGWYLFGDYCSGLLFGIRSDAAAPADGSALAPRVLLETGRSISSFGTDTEGDLYLTDIARWSAAANRGRRLTEGADGAHRAPSAAPDHEMIEQLDVEQPARLGQLGRDAQVLAGRARDRRRDGCGPR